VAELLAPANDVVVPDLLGFGRSPRPDELHPEAQAAALEDALGRAGINRATLVGHDFGGPISLSLYRRRPELFGSLALMATNAFHEDINAVVGEKGKHDSERTAYRHTTERGHPRPPVGTHLFHHRCQLALSTSSGAWRQSAAPAFC